MEIIRLHTVYNILHVNQVYLIFLAKLKDLNYSAGIETSEIKLFTEKDIPWKELAFHSNQFALEKYFGEPDFGGVHIGTYRKGEYES